MTQEELDAIRERCDANKSREGLVPFWSSEYEQSMCDAAALLAEVERLRAACISTERDVQQTLGVALRYPWFCDDPDNWPDATEADGVCVGQHVAVTLAAEAAKEIARLRDLPEAAKTNQLEAENQTLTNEMLLRNQ